MDGIATDTYSIYRRNMETGPPRTAAPPSGGLRRDGALFFEFFVDTDPFFMYNNVCLSCGRLNCVNCGGMAAMPRRRVVGGESSAQPYFE